ncbi:P-loop containing nucleoside triphosphate hydrolase [Phytophthora cactorum]|nr:P-loop containing nucleoside triphosphate hydrolase [Phytophthora cactorum]
MRGQIFNILRRLAAIAAAIQYVIVSMSATWWALQVLSGAHNPTETLRVFPSSLIQVGNQDSTENCSTAPLFNPAIYNFDFLSERYQGIIDDTKYNITHLDDLELVVIVVDCTFRQILVGDPSVLRVFNLVRSRADPSELYLITVSLNVQEYELRNLKKKGSALVGMLTLVQDMQAEKVQSFYMVATSYPYERVPSFEMYELVGVTSQSFLELRSIPRDPLTHPVKHLLTARKRGFFNGDAQRNVRVMYSILDGLNAKTALTRWEWIGEAVIVDSWAWVHCIHFFFGLQTIYSLIVLFLVTYQKFRSGKVWIGDPFSSISTADLVLRGFLVLFSCFLDNFWSVNEYAMSRASMLTGSQTVRVHKAIMHADIMAIFLSLVGFISASFASVSTHQLPFSLRVHPQVPINFGTHCTSGCGENFDLLSIQWERGIAKVTPVTAAMSPMRMWSSFQFPAKDPVFIIVSFFPTTYLLVAMSALAILRKIYQYRFPERVHVRSSQSTDTSGSEKAAMSTKGIVTNFEISTGAMLRTRFGLISDYNNYVYFKGMKFASPDGVYGSGYVVVNGKFLVSTKKLLAIVLIKLLHARFTNVYAYEVDGNTVKDTARLVGEVAEFIVAVHTMSEPPPSPGGKKKMPKHLRHAVSSRSKVVTATRSKRKPRVYLVKRFTGEPMREWVQRNLESSLAGNTFSATMAILSTFQALFHVSLNWTGLRIGLDSWMQGTKIESKSVVLELIECVRPHRGRFQPELGFHARVRLISTLGYGDIAPVSTSGKFVIAFVILFTFIVVPIQVNRIQATITSHTDYSSPIQRPNCTHTNLNWNERVVILNAAPPTPEINKVLHAYDSKVQYIVGSPMLDEDLTRAVLCDASACYVLVNRQSSRPQYADQCCALITIALRRGNPTCPIYAQIINSRNAATLLKMGASDVVVVGMLKFSILGRSCQVNGLPTLLLNLLAQCNSDLDSHHSSLQWQCQYLHGYMHGIFLVDIPRTFSSLTFGDLIRFLYDKASIIPLAMLTDDGVRFIDMDFKLGATADPTLCCKVYAIAKGLSAVEGVMKIPPEQILSYRKGMRRKGKSTSTNNLMDMKKIKPALGNEIEQIHESVINMYSVAEGYDVEAAMGLADKDASGYNTSSPERLLGKCRTSKCLDEREFERLRGFCDVYFVQGSPVNFGDLKKTNIRFAISVLILTQASEAQYSDPNMVDADAITIVRYIVEISQRTRMPNLVVELDKSSNVKLLSSLANERRTSSAFGLPALVVRNVSYRSPRRDSVSSLARRDSFWSSLDEGDGNTDASLVLEEFIASGRVFMNSMLDSLMSECYRKPWITQFLHILISGSVNDLEPCPASRPARSYVKMSAFRSKFLYPAKVNWFPGHMALARRQMVAQMDAVDVLIEVRDARIPWSSANPVLEEAFGKSKPRLVVFNKSDLANSNMQQKVEKQCKNQLGEATDCLFTSVTKGKRLQAILQWCNKHSQAQFKSTAGSMVMVVGIPNVGKSSLINEFRRLSNSGKLAKGRSRATVGPTPGVTVNDKPAVYVVDTPGVMLPNIPSSETGMRLALTGAIKDDVVGTELIADYMLFLLNQMKSTRYVDALKLPGPTDNIGELFKLVYKRCGALGKEPDVQDRLAAQFLLAEFRRGAFGNFTLDPIETPSKPAAPSSRGERRNSTYTDSSAPPKKNKIKRNRRLEVGMIPFPLFHTGHTRMTDTPTRVSMAKVIPKDASGKVAEMIRSSGRSGTNQPSSSPKNEAPLYTLPSPKTPNNGGSAPASPQKGTRLHIMGASMHDLKLNHIFRPRGSRNGGTPSRQEDIGISFVSLEFSNAEMEQRFTLARCVKYQTRLKFGAGFTAFFIPLLVIMQVSFKTNSEDGTKWTQLPLVMVFPGVVTLMGLLVIFFQHFFMTHMRWLTLVCLIGQISALLDTTAAGTMVSERNIWVQFIFSLGITSSTGLTFLKSTTVLVCSSIFFLILAWVRFASVTSTEQLSAPGTVSAAIILYSILLCFLSWNWEYEERRDFVLTERLAQENVMVQMTMEMTGWFSGGAADQSPDNRSDAGGILSANCHIDPKDVLVKEELGEGTFGCVYAATWKETRVAVKKITLQGDTKSIVTSFGSEASVMAQLAPKRCDVHGRHGSPGIRRRGMHFLHSSKPPILHRDLKSVNLLIDADWRCKVSDFGLSKLKAFREDRNDASMSASTNTGTKANVPRVFIGSSVWIAPEVFKGEEHTEKTDVYSFGVIIFEALTSSVPYNSISVDAVPFVVQAGKRPIDFHALELPPGDAMQDLYSLMTRCWSAEIYARPSFSVIISTLQSILTKHCGDEKWEDHIIYPDRKIVSASNAPADDDGLSIREEDLVVDSAIGRGVFGVVIMKGLHHPNIVLFMGSCSKPPTLLLVTELLANGSFFDIYHKMPRPEPARQLRLAHSVAFDMAKGLAYLHNHNPIVIHRDLKSQNILLDDRMRTKIADFGLSKFRDVGKTMSICGSPLWVAPEVLRGEKYGTPCDVYSFSIIVWEALAWGEPYPDLGSSDIMNGVAGGNLRPTVPDGTPAPLARLLEECWTKKQDQRPTFNELVPRLEAMAKDFGG